MKKILLSICLSLFAIQSFSQIVFYVEPPSTNQGNYDFTYAEGADWGSPDLSDPLNAVQDTLVFAEDATAADSLACNAVITDVDSQIAVLYRGDCEFGVKALNAQNAGAIAVVIINNVPGAPVGMGGGAQGTNVTIPVVMISDVDGATLKAEIEAGNTTAFIGSKTGYYNDDIGIYPENILRPAQFGNVQALSQDASEFDVQLGAWVFNYGNNAMNNVTLNAVVDNGSVLYDQTSTPLATLASGDSAWIALPTFSQSSYPNGYYDITYTIDATATDEFPDDNSVEADFVMSDSIYAFSRLDPTSLAPLGGDYFRGANSTQSNSACMHFRDPNASRIAIAGMRYSAVSTQNPNPTSLDGEFVDVIAYRWDDSFTDLNDANFTGINTLTPIATGQYIYLSDLQGDSIYVPFDQPVLLEDDQRYLFCINHQGENLFTAYDSGLDYAINFDTLAQPQFPGESDGSWFVAGFGTDVVPAISLHVFESAVGLEEEAVEEDIVPYPNPANEFVNVPLAENYGATTLTITDLNGKVVRVENIVMTTNVLKVDVTDLATGAYVFNLTHGEEMDSFTVNVTK